MKRAFYILPIFLFLCALCSMALGPAFITPGQVFRALFNIGPADELMQSIVLHVRLPRMIAAGVVGACLSCAGVLLQGITRNPLADPFLLGTSAGASLFAVLAQLMPGLVYFLGPFQASLPAFVGALLAVFLVLGLARRAGHAGQINIVGILLAGLVTTAFLGAMTSLVLFKFDPFHVKNATNWLMGGIGIVGTTELTAAICFCTLVGIGAQIMAKSLNALALGPDTAQTLGISPRLIILLSVIAAAALTAIAVSLAGLVGFVGIIVPHALRKFVGHDHRALIPAALIGGAGFMMLSDTLARVLVAPMELPVGILTSLAGAPLFLSLMSKHSKHVGTI